MDADLERRITALLLGRPLVNNAFRGLLVEAMLAQVLEPDWRWCSQDWASHDFENAAGVRLEVKQSAALQSWSNGAARASSGRFDIAPRKLRWEGDVRTRIDGRHAAIYVLAWHPEADLARADHRCADQWQFFCLAEQDLPNQKSIAINMVKAMVKPVAIDRVREMLAQIVSR
ncbi:hypothetical protein [Porphyrobacter sp. YT40]|uniref:hypothetical protein n=1 Tax=Porphyrobacter sp. YT40 TaxID=2547601 RepID=UPI0011447753|nr:hypothetical protein [Porphyrobacter sp. YT40]QDH35874.1 hypothetical protein E2E27_17045 [Porphyrobacter sp. YT40]